MYVPVIMMSHYFNVGIIVLNRYSLTTSRQFFIKISLYTMRFFWFEQFIFDYNRLCHCLTNNMLHISERQRWCFYAPKKCFALYNFQFFLRVNTLLIFLVLFTIYTYAQEEVASEFNIPYHDTSSNSKVHKEKWLDDSEFSLFIAAGQYGLNRTSSLIVSPLVINNKNSYSIGIASNLANYRHYKARLYVAYEQVGIEETFRRIDQSLFQSNLKFKSANVGIIPLVFSIGDSFGAYSGIGVFAQYHLNIQIDSLDGSEFNIDIDKVFERFGYGTILQLGVFYKNLRIEINGFNSFSDTSEVVGIPNLRRIGSTISLHYGF